MGAIYWAIPAHVLAKGQRNTAEGSSIFRILAATNPIPSMSKELWEQLWTAWKSSAVPPVQVRKFAAGDAWNIPWVQLEGVRNMPTPAATSFATAEHLVCRLAGKDPELIAAYKIHAYLVHSDRRGVLQDALAHAMRKHGEQLDGWWKPTVRYVLPAGSYTYTIPKLPLDIPDGAWPLMIEQAARAWSDIAKVWTVVHIAAFLAYDSPEYLAVSRISIAQMEKNEREHYLSLKNKYEGEQR
jgi:hypothetical protein